MGGVLKQTKGALHVVLLAGGGGTRFWPWSTRRRPKQFLDLTGEGPLIELAWRRARRLVPASRIWAVAPKPLGAALRRALPHLRAANVIVEPAPRDTAPAIGLACATVARRDPAAVVVVLPTDHVVRDLPAFVTAVRAAEREARRGSLVCLGVRPDRPATGFGYLRCAAKPARGRAVPVAAFVEKPDLARAKRFVASGKHLWNGGMFVWRAARLLEELGRHAPKTVAAVAGTIAGRKSAWDGAARCSIDYAVMEKADGVAVVPLDAGWDDLGSWDAAASRLPAGDSRDVLRVDSPGSVVFGSRRLVAILGVPNVAIVEAPNALLVLARGQGERVREIVARLGETRRKGAR